MSSNHVYMRKTDWNRMQDEIRRDEALVIETQQEIERIRRILNDRSREAENARESARRRVDAAIQSLRDSFQESTGRIQGSTNVELRHRQDEFNEQLRVLTSQLTNSANRLNETNRRVEAVSNSFNEAFDTMTAQMNSAKDKALAIKVELDSLITQIDSLNPSHFSPAEYSQLLSLRSYMNDDINRNDFESAIAVSQNGIVDASRLLARLIVENNIYDEGLSQAREIDNRIRESVERLSSDQSFLHVTLDGTERIIDYDIRRWSHGRFNELENQLINQETLMDSNSATSDQMNRIINNLSILEEEFRNCDLAAREARCNSLAAADSANRIHQALTDSAWTLVDSGYVDNDDRNPYRLLYEDNAGNTSAILVSPEESGEASYFMEVFSENENLAAQTKRGLYNSLGYHGLDVAEPEIRNDCQLNTDPDEFINDVAEEAMENMELSRRRVQAGK